MKYGKYRIVIHRRKIKMEPAIIFPSGQKYHIGIYIWNKSLIPSMQSHSVYTLLIKTSYNNKNSHSLTHLLMELSPS
jgi:hypothetical protein